MNQHPKNKALSIYITLFLCFSLAAAQQPVWITVDTVKTFPETESLVSAKNKTLAFARQCALQKAVPEEVAVTSLLTDFSAETKGISQEQTAYSIFALSSVAGYITEQKVLDLTIIPLENNLIKCRIKLKAKVEPTQGERNPALALKLQVNDNYLPNGSALTIKARASQPGYLYLFDFMADNNVLLMYPNEYDENNKMPAGEWVEIPQAEYRFTVYGMPVAEVTTETLFGILCVNPIAGIEDFQNVQPKDHLPGSIVPGDSFTEFQKWLARVPLSQRTEQTLQIHIVKE